MTTKELLDKCADMVLQCDDGTLIPCCTYNCVSASGVMRNLLEMVDDEVEYTYSKSADGRRPRIVVPFPNVPSDMLLTTMDVIHGVRSIASMTLADVSLTFRGMDLLDCSCMHNILLTRVWQLVCTESNLEAILEHAAKMVRCDMYRTQFLTRLFQLAPLWTSFRELVFPRLDMDFPLAKVLGPVLMKVFPAALVFKELLETLPASVFVKDGAMFELIGDTSNGVYYHPLEMEDVLHAAQIAMESASQISSGSNCPAAAAFRAIRTAMLVYDVAPTSASSMHGTVITYERVRAASVMLVVEKRLKKTKQFRATKWLRVLVDPAAGTIDFGLRLADMDENGREARAAQVRIMAWATDRPTPGEVWMVYTAPFLQPWMTLSKADASSTFGSELAMRATVQSSRLHKIRVDVFYGRNSVFTHPFVTQ